MLAVGPEHPQYIEVPQPPQQALPYRPFIKGRLPVPRDIFVRSKGKDLSADEEIAKSAPDPVRPSNHPRGSRNAWRNKLADARRENLREGLKSLRYKKTRTEARLDAKAAASMEARERDIRRPEREDERLTTPSTGLDVEKLLHGRLQDPNREARLAQKARNLELQTAAQRANRADSLHTLYTNARHFIVNPQQLDEALDKEFGTSERPRVFADRYGTDSYGSDDVGRWSSDVTSMWANGPPLSIQEMLNGGSRPGDKNTNRPQDKTYIAEERMKRIAEKLTGGKMAE